MFGVRNATADETASRETLQILVALNAMRNGDFTTRLPVGDGVHGKIADAFNDIATANEGMALELYRVSQVVGIEGKVRQLAGFWGGS